MNSDGTGVTRIAAGYDPDFAPDGSKIVIRQSRLILVNTDGSNPEEFADEGSDPA
ncbi:hypothetical protein [Nocardia sp. NPDC060249]|uniref:hypothetical protein n=1 Tax=Nocardia sp. NPDC060249 TaxID=3347082 RepID=UPI00364C3FAC